METNPWRQTDHDGIETRHKIDGESIKRAVPAKGKFDQLICCYT
jgi:hypothetical protein